MRMRSKPLASLAVGQTYHNESGAVRRVTGLFGKEKTPFAKWRVCWETEDGTISGTCAAYRFLNWIQEHGSLRHGHNPPEPKAHDALDPLRAQWTEISRLIPKLPRNTPEQRVRLREAFRRMAMLADQLPEFHLEGTVEDVPSFLKTKTHPLSEIAACGEAE